MERETVKSSFDGEGDSEVFHSIEREIVKSFDEERSVLIGGDRRARHHNAPPRNPSPPSLLLYSEQRRGCRAVGGYSNQRMDQRMGGILISVWISVCGVF